MESTNQQLPARRSVRLPYFDYAEGRAYFITICSADRRCIFGKVRGGEVALGEAGKAVAAEWNASAQHRANLVLDEMVVMPNHVHGIVILQETGTARCAPTAAKERSFGRIVSATLPAFVRAFKSASTRQIRRLSTQNVAVWQRGYHEHVIRDEKDLFEIQKYIRDNPAQWEFDAENPRNEP